MATGRFDWIWGGTSSRHAPWDVDLQPDAPFATVPTRGSIVPRWLMVVPRRPALNVASLPPCERVALLDQAHKIASRLAPGQPATYFEHGPAAAGRQVGCGVDQAHFHCVVLPFDLFDALPAEMGWRDVQANDPWQSLGSNDYLLASNGKTWKACEPKFPQSQFFRRVIAAQVGCAEAWNHNTHTWDDNVRRTIAAFGETT